MCVREQFVVFFDPLPPVGSQIFTQFIVYCCFGDTRKLRRGSKVTDDEEEPLISDKDRNSSIPCFSSHGNIQGVGEEGRASSRTKNGYSSLTNNSD